MKRDVAIHRRIETRPPTPLRAREFSLVNMTAFAPKNVKPATRKGQFLLVNASAYFVKEKPKNVLTDEGIAAVSDVFQGWEAWEKLSRVVSLEPPDWRS